MFITSNYLCLHLCKVTAEFHQIHYCHFLQMRRSCRTASGCWWTTSRSSRPRRPKARCRPNVSGSASSSWSATSSPSATAWWRRSTRSAGRRRPARRCLPPTTRGSGRGLGVESLTVPELCSGETIRNALLNVEHKCPAKFCSAMNHTQEVVCHKFNKKNTISCVLTKVPTWFISNPVIFSLFPAAPVRPVKEWKAWPESAPGRRCPSPSPSYGEPGGRVREPADTSAEDGSCRHGSGAARPSTAADGCVALCHMQRLTVNKLRCWCF